MENKLVNFVRGFNSELEDNIQLQYINNGYTEAIILPKIHLFDDDNDSREHVEERSLSRLVRNLDTILTVANDELTNKVEDFFAEKKIKTKQKFPNVKIDFSLENHLRYNTFVSGEYNEDIMEQFLDVIKQDFEYIFEGLILDVEI